MGKHIALVVMKLLKDQPICSVRLENKKLVLEPASCQRYIVLDAFVIMEHILGLAMITCSQLVSKECQATKHGRRGRDQLHFTAHFEMFIQKRQVLKITPLFQQLWHPK